MESLTMFVNLLWGSLTIVAQVLTITFVLAHLIPKLRTSAFVTFFTSQSMLIAGIVAFLATVGSLIYSDIIGYTPCKLCWLQRVFIYPQVILLGVAFFRKDEWMKLYAIILSLIGGSIALFHYTGQLGLTTLPCSAVGVSVSCVEKFVLKFGYITIPLMAFSACIFIASLLILSGKKEKNC